MFRQRATGKAVATNRAVLIDHVHDTSGIQGMESEVPDQNRNRCTDFDRRGRRVKTDPRDIEYLPFTDRLCGSTPGALAPAEENTIAIYVAPTRHVNVGSTNLGIGKGRILLLRNKSPKILFRWFFQAKQEILRMQFLA
jgi:hypothetical protein